MEIAEKFSVQDSGGSMVGDEQLNSRAKEIQSTPGQSTQELSAAYFDKVRLEMRSKSCRH